MTLHEVLFIAGSLLTAVATLLFAKKVGDRWSVMYWDWQIGSIGIIVILSGVFTGLFSRAVEYNPVETPFVWYHWIVLGGAILAVVGYGNLQRRHLRYGTTDEAVDAALDEIISWLDHIERQPDCPTESCMVVRSQVQDLNRRLRARKCS